MTSSVMRPWFRLAATMLCLLCAAPWARAADAAGETVFVEANTHKLLRLDAAVGRVAVGNPKIADVNLVNGHELLVNGKAPGVTSLMIWPRGNDKGGTAIKQYRVSVGPLPSTDPELAGMHLTPAAPIDGTAPNLLAHRRATQSVPLSSDADGKSGAPVADRSSVGGGFQVQSDVRVVEVNRSAAEQIGFSFSGANRAGTVYGMGAPGTYSSIQANSTQPSTFFNSQGTPVGGSATSATGFLPLASAFNLVYAGTHFLSSLSLLEQRGLARTLAEPSLTAISGQTASFLAGGEFPYPVPQSSGGSASTITIQFREYGVRLNLTPTVLTQDRIALKVAPEVSELDFTNAVTILGTQIPGLIVRRTDTTVELGDGETFVLSGLVSETIKNNVDKVPGLGDLPVLGAFFRSTSISRAQKELIMVVTPHLVHPLAKGTVLPPLPGQSISNYRPGTARTIFLENGSFGQSGDSGYGQ